MASLLARLRRRRREVQSRSQIARMNGRMLADIGVTRGDIPAMVRKLR